MTAKRRPNVMNTKPKTKRSGPKIVKSVFVVIAKVIIAAQTAVVKKAAYSTVFSSYLAHTNPTIHETQKVKIPSKI